MAGSGAPGAGDSGHARFGAEFDVVDFGLRDGVLGTVRWRVVAPGAEGKGSGVPGDCGSVRRSVVYDAAEGNGYRGRVDVKRPEDSLRAFEEAYSSPFRSYREAALVLLALPRTP